MFTFVPMSTAIVLMAFGKKEYYQMAYNMALSIRRFNNDIPIHLIHDDKYSLPDHKSWVFSIRTPIDERDLYQNGLFSPGMAKLNIDRYLVHNVNIYLDVDGICIKPFDDIILKAQNSPGYFYALISNHWWATKETIWHYHEMPKNVEIPTINSSFLILKKGKQLSHFYAQARENALNGVPLNKLSMKWGRTYPDELALNVACVQLNVNPNGGFDPVKFFGQHHKNIDDMISEAADCHFISLFGGAGYLSRSIWENCDQLLYEYHKDMGLNHEYKWHKIHSAKHASNANLQEGRPPKNAQ